MATCSANVSGTSEGVRRGEHAPHHVTLGFDVLKRFKEHLCAQRARCLDLEGPRDMEGTRVKALCERGQTLDVGCRHRVVDAKAGR